MTREWFRSTMLSGWITWAFIILIFYFKLPCTYTYLFEQVHFRKQFKVGIINVGCCIYSLDKLLTKTIKWTVIKIQINSLFIIYCKKYLPIKYFCEIQRWLFLHAFKSYILYKIYDKNFCIGAFTVTNVNHNI